MWWMLLNKEEVDSAVRNNLKLAKAAGIDNVVAEHLIYVHLAIIYHLTNIFKWLLIHDYVPNKFGHTIIVPLIKDRSRDYLNYLIIEESRSVQEFQSCLKPCLSIKFSDCLSSHSLQFVFKKNSSWCASLLFNKLLIKRGSCVFCLHLMLVNSLWSCWSQYSTQETCYSQCFINIIIIWYSKLNA